MIRFFSMCRTAKASSNKNLFERPAFRKNISRAANDVSMGIPQVNKDTNHPIKH
jgi:hypothetical protein